VVDEVIALGGISGVEQEDLVALRLVVVLELHRRREAERLVVEKVMPVGVVGVDDGDLRGGGRLAARLLAELPAGEAEREAAYV
jgi:hypothetical protein